MDRDRWAYLAIRAYAKGLLNFSHLEQEDDRWRLREEILLAEVEREALAKLHEMIHLAEVSAAQYTEHNTFEPHYKAAQKQYHAYSKLMYPFGTDDRSIDKKLVDDLTSMWVNAFGDPDGPAVQKTIEYLKNMGKSDA